MLAKILYITLATNHVDKYYAFPSHFCLNTCSAGDNYAHARTVNTRLSLSAHQKPGYEANKTTECLSRLLKVCGKEQDGNRMETGKVEMKVVSGNGNTNPLCSVFFTDS